MNLKNLSPWFWTTAASFLLFLLLAFHKNIDYDMGFHLNNGRWIAENHAIPRTDICTYTALGHEYIDLHWLYQIGCWAVFQAWGFTGLSAVNLLLLTAVGWLTAWRMRRSGTPWPFLALFWAATVIAVEFRFLVRPEVVTWLLLCLTLVILDERLEGRSDRLVLLPFIQLLWVNVEGLFILGLVVQAAYQLTNRLHFNRWDRKLWKMSLASLAACLANPYFLKGALFPFLLFTRIEQSSVFKNAISEFQSPWHILRVEQDPFAPMVPIDTYQVFSLFLLGLIVLTLSKRKVHEILLPGAFFFLSVAAIRNMPLFFWVTLPIAGKAAGELLAHTGAFWTFIREKLLGNRMAWAFTLFVLLFASRVATQAYFLSDRRFTPPGLGLDEDHLPMAAFRFMAENRLKGRVLNDLGMGGFLEFETQAPAFIDGRLEVMGDDLFKQYVDSYRPQGWGPLLLQYKPDIVLYDHMSYPIRTVELEQSPGYHLVYWDNNVALWMRVGYRDDLPALTWDQVLAQWNVPLNPSDDLLDRSLARPYSSWADWLSGFFESRTYPQALVRLSAFAYETGHPDLARDILLEALKESDGRYYEIYFNLGATYAKLGEPTRARLCYERVLEMAPSYERAREKLEQL